MNFNKNAIFKRINQSIRLITTTISVIFIVLLAFTTCGSPGSDSGGGDGSGGTHSTTDIIAVTGVSLKASTSLAVGGTETLTPTITPSDATNRNVTWNSSNTAVATVSTDGVVKGVSAGTALIIVATRDGGHQALCNVTVHPNVIHVTGVSLNKSSANIIIGDTEILTAAITPYNATNQNVTWSSSNTAVATVTEGGMVIAVAAGNANITVTTDDGSYHAVCAVTVRPITVTGVSLKASTYLVVGNTETLYAIIEPDNATNQNVTWSSSNTAAATVSTSGVVTAVSAGTATITVTTVDGGYKAYCSVTVSNYAVSVTGVSLNKSSANLVIGHTEELTATITPYNATNQNVTWNSSNTNVATVSAGGLVTAKNVGTATITVKTVDGDKTASCNVIVNPKVITFTVDPIHAQTYTGSEIRPVVKVRDGATVLTLTTDYTVVYINNTNPGTATATINGKGNYEGSSGSGTFTIYATPTADDFIINGTGSFYYDGNPKTVTITPKSGKSKGAITIKYNDNIIEPSAVGTYNVTFDVVAATGFSAVNGLYAGIMTITPFTSIAELKIYLQDRPANTAATPYIIALNVDDISTLRNNLNGRYIYLDLSGSTITAIPNYAFSSSSTFEGLGILTGIIIPNSVTSIGRNAFYNCRNLTSVTIGNGVTSIGDNAFASCGSLTSVTIGNSVTSIGTSDFLNCYRLIAINIDSGNKNYSSEQGVLFNKDKSKLIIYPAGKAGTYIIPNSVTSIGNYAFNGCTGLTSVTIPNSVTSIGNKAFWSCTSLTSITIPDSVTSSIEEDFFRGCDSLTNVTIGSGITYIDPQAFIDCKSLSLINVDENNTNYSSDQGILYNKNKTTVIRVPEGKTDSFNYPNSVTSIGDSAFYEVKNLISITITNNITNIGDNAFSGCGRLERVIFNTGTVVIGSKAFIGGVYGNGGMLVSESDALKQLYNSNGAGTYYLSYLWGDPIWVKQQ